MSNRWGILVAIEGIDGSGTTTFSKRLYDKLSNIYDKVFLTHEPTESILGLIARSILQGDVSDKYERSDILAYLFVADRIYHFYEKEVAGIRGGLLSLLRNGFVIITDRYKYSTIVYQSLARRNLDDLPLQFLMELNSVVPPPHILVLLKVSPEKALERIRSRETLSVDEKLQRLNILSKKFEEVSKLLEKEKDGLWKSKIPDIESFMPEGFPKVVEIVNEEADDLERGLMSVIDLIMNTVNK